IVLAPPTLPGGTAGTAYNQTITASGGTAPYTFAVTAGSLPAGLSLSASGVLSGTPTAAGTFNFTVTATDANGFTGTQGYAITIAAPSIVLAPAALPNGTAGTAYNQTITASGGTAPYTFAVIAGALPPGLTLSASGVLSGTPTLPGTYSFTVRATDQNGFTGNQAYAVTILIPGGVPQAVSRQVSTLMDVPVQVDLTAGATGGPFVAANILSVTPAGTATVAQVGANYIMTFTPAPGFVGVATVTFTVSSQYATSPPATITINVDARPDPTQDADVVGLNAAQQASVRRFADTQIINLQDRLESLHDSSGTGWGYWIAGTTRQGDRDDSATAARQDFGTSGGTLGADYRFNERFAIGLGLGYDRDRTDVGVQGSQSEARAISGLAYGSFQPGLPFFVDAAFGHQRLTFQLRRRVPQTQVFVTSPREGTQDFTSWSAGYNWKRDTWELNSYARMDAAQAQLDDYTEHGDDIHALNYDEQSIATRTSTLGARWRMQRKVRWGELEPRVRLEFQRDFHDQSGATIHYADTASGPSYSLLPDELDRSRVILELGAVLITKYLTMNLEYRGIFGGIYDNDQSLTLTFEKEE
ncbi:MAG: autotransporter domain-containing protein, partial [Gammaproteobacteria bacterium]|nr:autotransporter domain-containing protein [Gammaproteobacteria bacterium]